MQMDKYLKSNEKFIKAEVEILPNRDYEMIIEDVIEEEMPVRDGGKPETKPVMYFRNSKKAFPLNKLNGRTIQACIGSGDTNDWIGRKILLYVNWEAAFGAEQWCIRVRPKGYISDKVLDVPHSDADEDDIPFVD